VVQASLNDFEEFGVDGSTLEEMKQVSDSLATARPSHLPFVVAAPQSRLLRSALFHVFFLSVTVILSSPSLRLMVARCSLAWW
jgi:hypothetical protein